MLRLTRLAWTHSPACLPLYTAVSSLVAASPARLYWQATLYPADSHASLYL